jgi:hypothetical protein
MVDRIGARYGFSKRCSDAQSEWWHIKYDPACNHATWHGTDPGPYGKQPQPPPEPAPPPEQTIAAAGGELFIETERGEVFRRRGDGWQSMGTPGR